MGIKIDYSPKHLHRIPMLPGFSWEFEASIAIFQTAPSLPRFQERQQQHSGFRSFPTEVYQSWSKRFKILISSILRVIVKVWANLYNYSVNSFCSLLQCNLQIFFVLICFVMKNWGELMKVQSIFGEGNGTPLQYSCLEKSYGRRSLVGCSPWGREELDTTERLHFHFSLSCTGEGNGNPLQCSCLENPRDGGAWWATVYGVTQSRTWLKWLSSSSSSSSSPSCSCLTSYWAWMGTKTRAYQRWGK